MGSYCSFGEIDKNYFYIILVSSITLGTGFLSMYLFKFNSGSGIVEGIEDNKLLKAFSRYLGFDLCYFGELILRKLIKGSKKRNNDDLNNIKKKNSKIIDFIISDPKNKFEKKDILYFILMCLINLIDDFMILFIKIKKGIPFLISTEEYNSIEFFFLFIVSIFLFKVAYYKHQYFSIIIIILLEILRYVIKILSNYSEKPLISVLFLQIIRALCDSILYGYIKALIQFKFFFVY